MTAHVYVYHSGQPNAPALTAAGGAGQLDALLYAIGVTGFGAITLDSLAQTGGVATATRAAGLNLADGITGMPHIIQISGSTNGWDGEYTLNAAPGSTSCTFTVPSGLPSPATGTITLKRAPAGMTRLASSGNKAVYQFADTLTMPGYLMVDDSNAQYALVRLAEAAASPVEHATMTGLCPTVAQLANGLYWRKTDGGGSTARPWIAVVWQGGIYLGIAWANGSPTLHDMGYAGMPLSYKPADAFGGIIIGNTSLPGALGASNNFISKNGGSQMGQYIQRTHTQQGSALAFTKIGTAFGTTIGGAGGPTDANVVDNANHIRGPIDISEGATQAGTPLRGRMPLLWDPINVQNKAHLDMLVNLANLPGRTVLLVKAAMSNVGYFCGFDITGPAE